MLWACRKHMRIKIFAALTSSVSLASPFTAISYIAVAPVHDSPPNRSRQQSSFLYLLRRVISSLVYLSWNNQWPIAQSIGPYLLSVLCSFGCTPTDYQGKHFGQ